MRGEMVRHRHSGRQTRTPAVTSNTLSLREREALLAKQQFIVCDEIFSDGRADSHQMRRADLFSYLDQATTQITRQDEARSSDGYMIQCDVCSGKSKGVPKLHQRDIRKLDSSFSNASEPVILCRRHSIVINIDPIRFNTCDAYLSLITIGV